MQVTLPRAGAGLGPPSQYQEGAVAETAMAAPPVSWLGDGTMEKLSQVLTFSHK